MRRLAAGLGLAILCALVFARLANADGIERNYPLTGQPRTIAVDPADGRIYVANATDGQGYLSVIDPVSGQVTNHPTSGTPNVLALDSAHGRIYVANYNQTFDVFDVPTMTRIATLPVYGLGIAVDTATQRVYVTGATALTVVDGATNTVVATRPAIADENWYAVAVDPSLHRVYVANYFLYPEGSPPIGPSLIVLDDRDLSIITEFRLPARTRWGLAVDQIRHRVYVAGGGSSATDGYLPKLVVYDGASLAELGRVALHGDPAGIALGPDRIYVTDAVQGYFVVDADTLQVTQALSTSPVRPFLPALDPTGRLYIGALDDYGPDFVAMIGTGNHAPAIGLALLYPTSVTTDETLQFQVSAIDGDFAIAGGQRDPVTFAYEWTRNGTVIAGETASTLDLSRPGAGDRGDTITARVTVTDPQGLTASATRSTVIGNVPPFLTVSLSSTSPRASDTLTVIASATDVDGDPIVLTYEWLRNGLLIPGATTASLDLALNSDPGDRILARVTATDDHGGTRVEGATALVLPDAGSFLFLDSQPGDFVGRGLRQLLMSPAWVFQASLPPGGSTFSLYSIPATGWSVTVSAPIGVPLAVGSYTGAVRSAFRPAGSPGLDVSGESRGCNTLTGRFTVNEIAYSQYNELMLFDASFEQHCEGATPALFGHIRVEIPPPTPGVTLPTGSIAVPTSGSFLYMNSQGEYIGQGREHLYTQFDSAVHGDLPLGGSQFSANVTPPNTVAWWSVNIAAPSGEALALGSYIRAARAPFPPAGSPGLSVDGDGRGCNTVNGKFDVDELSYSPRGDLLVFQATFEQHCEGNPSPLFGRIRIENPTWSPGVTLPSGSITVPTSGTFLYLNSEPGEFVGAGLEQLFTSGNSAVTWSFSDSGDFFRGSVVQGTHTWNVDIAAPPGQVLAAGSYVKAVRAASRSVGPGLEIRGDGRSCGVIKGKFDVDQRSSWPNGELNVFQATFEQHCLGRVLSGRIRIEMAPPVELVVTAREDGSVVNKSGVATLRGTLACSRAAAVDLAVTLTQVQSRGVTVTGTVTVRINCSGPAVTWSQAIPPDIGGFKAGPATAMWNATVCEPGRACVSAPGTRTVKLNVGK